MEREQVKGGLIESLHGLLRGSPQNTLCGQQGGVAGIKCKQGISC